MQEKISKLQYLAALRIAGFETITEFADHYELNKSTVTKIINGDTGLCGKEYIEKFQSLICDELEYVLAYPDKISHSSSSDQEAS